MKQQVYLLLNIKPDEYPLVRNLFLVQFFLGIATAFLFTCSLTLFLSAYETDHYPKIYLLAAGLLLAGNAWYSRLEERYSSVKLLRAVILLAAISIFINWAGIYFVASHRLTFFLTAWYIVVYMVIGYAFWGLTAMQFNVRESKRLFAIVGSGDIPAKMLGYFSVSALVPFIDLIHLLWVSILSLLVAYILMRKFFAGGHSEIYIHASNIAKHSTTEHEPHEKPQSLLERYFISPFIFSIAAWSLLSYIIFALIDFTFLAEIKLKYTSREELATFIAVFFAIGRFLAILIKLLFSSKMISRMGLTNVLLVSPVLLLFFNICIVLAGGNLLINLYIFGAMVLITEVLRSALQEPVFFILFQPLRPHARLKGHLITKGYMLPVALFASGLYLNHYLEKYGYIAINATAQLLVILLILWSVSIYFIRKEYLKTLKKL